MEECLDFVEYSLNCKEIEICTVHFQAKHHGRLIRAAQFTIIGHFKYGVMSHTGSVK